MILILILIVAVSLLLYIIHRVIARWRVAQSMTQGEPRTPAQRRAVNAAVRRNEKKERWG
jgi:nitric oxide reductase large subunit